MAPWLRLWNFLSRSLFRQNKLSDIDKEEQMSLYYYIFGESWSELGGICTHAGERGKAIRRQLERIRRQIVGLAMLTEVR